MYKALLVLGMLGWSSLALALPPVTQPIRISVDGTQAPQKILHSVLTMPVTPGALTLYYPKWMVADHSPDGPITNLTGLEFSINGRPIPWRRDLVDMYAFHLQIPRGAHTLTVHLDFLLSAPGPTIDFAASASAKILVLMWNQVLLYPKGRSAHDILFAPQLKLPPGWRFNTALPVTHAGDPIEFATTSLELLVDSPVQSGEFIRAIPLSSAPIRELDLAADDPWALDIAPELIVHYKSLIEQAQLLYQSHHYRSYHFLLTLSDNVLPLGQEHHESSDDRTAEHTLSDPNRRLLFADLLPHEYTHSWNGQYRRPDGLATADFQQPARGDLLWVYEGLTEFLGTVLSARSGLWTVAEAHEQLAAVASTLAHRAGRSWRSLQDTADSAQLLYFAPSEWTSIRRSTDFYPESIFLWLDVDTTIRRLTHGTRSIDDFCRLFLAGPSGAPVVAPYSFADLVNTLNEVAPYDWRRFLRQRLDYTGPEAPLSGLAHSGWSLAYDDVPNVILSAQQAAFSKGDYTSSLGLVVQKDGRIEDVVPGMSVAQAGMSPYTRILSVGGHPFSIEELDRVVAQSKANGPAIEFIVVNAGSVERHLVHYNGGLRAPHLRRDDTSPDYLDDLLAPRQRAR
ncbi:MAG TPA: hypothetical protein VGG63_11850 [Steroidobacteraceae bacterium]